MTDFELCPKCGTLLRVNEHIRHFHDRKKNYIRYRCQNSKCHFVIEGNEVEVEEKLKKMREEHSKEILNKKKEIPSSKPVDEDNLKEINFETKTIPVKQEKPKTPKKKTKK